MGHWSSAPTHCCPTPETPWQGLWFHFIFFQRGRLLSYKHSAWLGGLTLVIPALRRVRQVDCQNSGQSGLQMETLVIKNKGWTLFGGTHCTSSPLGGRGRQVCEFKANPMADLTLQSLITQVLSLEPRKRLPQSSSDLHTNALACTHPHSYTPTR